jgi:hypothetical protein
MNNKFNKWFEQTAADPARRRAAIADYTKYRVILFCCAVVITGCALDMFFTGTRHPSSVVVESFAACMSWIVVVRVSSTRRVLKLLDQFLSRDEKTTA